MLYFLFADGIRFYESVNGVILSPGNSNGVIPKKYFKKAYNLSGNFNICINMSKNTLVTFIMFIYFILKILCVCFNWTMFVGYVANFQSRQTISTLNIDAT